METNEKAVFLQQHDPCSPVENCSSFSCFQANLWSLPSWSSVGRKIMQLRRHPQSSRPGQHSPSAYFGPKHNTTADFLHHGSACLLQLQIMHHYWTNLHINVNSHVHEQRFSGNYHSLRRTTKNYLRWIETAPLELTKIANDFGHLDYLLVFYLTLFCTFSMLY